MKVKSFKEIAINYKAIFFDAFGVLKNHKGIIPGIEDTFKFLDENGIDYYILTNDASRGTSGLAKYYQDHGMQYITEDKVFSSGMLARDWLQLKIKKGRVVYLGTPESAHYIKAAGLDVISIQQVDLEYLDDINCLVFLDDEGFDWNVDINKIINVLRKKNMSVVVANTDINYPANRRDINIAIGGIADMVEDILDKNFIRFGKPDAQMFMFGYEKANEKQPLNRDEILMVGDTLFTDIIGGNKFGLDTALVLSGNTLAENAKVKIKSTGIIPTYVCDSILT